MSKRTEVSIIIRARDSTRAAFRGVGAGLERLKSLVFSLKGLIIGLGAAAVVGTGKKLIGLWAKQEDAVFHLNAALKATGRYSEEASKKIQVQAAKLQEITAHGDEAIIAGISTISQLATQLNPDQLAKTEKVLVGIADTFFGGDIRSAALIVGKAIASPTNALSRYGITLDSTATQQEKFQQLLSKSKVFFDSSVEATKALKGTTEQLHNALGDLGETFGHILVDSFSYQEHLKEMTGKTTDFDKSLKNNMDTIVHWGRVIVAVVGSIIRTLWAPIQVIFNVLQSIGAAIDSIFLEISRELGVITNLARHIPIVGKHIPEVDTAKLADARNVAFASIADQGRDAINAIGKIGESWARTSLTVEGYNAQAQKALHPKGKGAGNKGEPGATETGDSLGQEIDLLVKGHDARVLNAKDMVRALEIEGEITKQLLSGNLALKDRLALTQKLQSIRQVTAIPGGHRGLAGVSGLQGGVPFGAIEQQHNSLSWGQKFAGSLYDALDAGQGLSDLLTNMTTSTIRGFGSAVEGAFKSFASGSVTAGQAFKAAMLGALASVARGFGDFFMAKAVASFAEAITFNPAAGGAAAEYIAAATAMYALAGLAGAASSGGGGGGAYSTAGQLAGAAQQGEATLIIEGGLLDMSDPRQSAAFSRALSNVSGRRVTVRGG